jgi:hypothetical protein
VEDARIEEKVVIDVDSPVPGEEFRKQPAADAVVRHRGPRIADDQVECLTRDWRCRQFEQVVGAGGHELAFAARTRGAVSVSCNVAGNTRLRIFTTISNTPEYTH